MIKSIIIHGTNAALNQKKANQITSEKSIYEFDASVFHDVRIDKRGYPGIDKDFVIVENVSFPDDYQAINKLMEHKLFLDEHSNKKVGQLIIVTQSKKQIIKKCFINDDSVILLECA